MATVGYLRIGPTEQDRGFQGKKLKEYGCDRIFKEKASLSERRRPELERAMASVQSGDKLVVYQMARLADSPFTLHKIAKHLQERGIGLAFIKEEIDLSTTSGEAMLSLLGALVEMERDVSNERKKESQERAKRQRKQIRKEKNERDVKRALELDGYWKDQERSGKPRIKLPGVSRSPKQPQANDVDRAGYEKLTDLQKRVFNQTHQKHLESMQYEKRKKYEKQQIKRIKWDPREKCIKVHFRNGEWYHYFRDYTWE